MSLNGKVRTNLPSELPITAKTQSPSCFLHSVVLRSYVGEQAAYIYSCLHSQKKMSLSQIGQKSGITGANLKKVLVTLIQLGCVVYITDKNNSNNVYYCHNEEGCWKLTYADEIVRHVREKFGQVHASVIQNVILRGHLTIGSYVDDMEVKSEIDKIEQAFTDLVDDQWLVTVRELDFKPLNATFSTCITTANREFNADSSQYMKNDNGMGDSGGSRFKTVGLSQLKKSIIIKDLAKEKFMKLYHDSNGKDKLHRIGTHNQRDDGSVPTNVNNLFSDEDDENEEEDLENTTKIGGGKLLRRLNGNVPLTVSFDRFLKHERDLQLVSISKHRIGYITSLIYDVVLSRVEKSSREIRNIEDIVDKLVADASVGIGSAGSSTSGYDPSIGRDLMKRLELRDQQKGMNFGAADILKELSMSNRHKLNKDDLIGTISNEDEDDEDGFKSNKKRKLEEAMNASNKRSKLSKLASQIKTFDDEENEDEDENEAEIDNGFDMNNSENSEILMLILQHLKLLTTDKSISFLMETTPGQFYVPFTVLQSQLPFYQMKQIIKNIFGTATLRVLNCIESRRLIEEKNIAKDVLMREGDVRKVIATLIKFGLVEIQEIPRTADRSAMRGIFAFRVNKGYQRGKEILAKCLMFNMGEILDQMEHIKMENKILLDKISREDVRGREVELLLESELAQLKKVVESEKIGLSKWTRLRAMGEMLWFSNSK